MYVRIWIYVLSMAEESPSLSVYRYPLLIFPPSLTGKEGKCLNMSTSNTLVHSNDQWKEIKPGREREYTSLARFDTCTCYWEGLSYDILTFIFLPSTTLCFSFSISLVSLGADSNVYTYGMGTQYHLTVVAIMHASCITQKSGSTSC